MDTELKQCAQCQANFSFSPGELAMYEKLDLVPSKICFVCGTKQRMAVWPFGKFRKATSDLSGDSIITILSKMSDYPIYNLKEWHSDEWDALTYAQEYNPERPFFDQLKELQKKVPRPHQNAGNNTSCDWCDDTWNSKNCYLSRSLEECEDVFYSYRVFRSKNSIELIFCFDCEFCYDCVYCFRSNKLFNSERSQDCINSRFLFDCKNCQDCFMCWNLRNKQYCIENVQYTKEEYQARLQEFEMGSSSYLESLRKKFRSIVAEQAVHRQNANIKTTNSEGNYLTNADNCQRCYGLQEAKDCYNMFRGYQATTMIDDTGCWYVELLGNCSCCVNAYGSKYCSWSQSRFSEYLDLCIDCENCFGCVGLKKKQYSILNKQYSKEEYEKLRIRIITDMKTRGEYGQFLPYSFGTVPYNFSTGPLYFPEITKEEIIKLGGTWEDLDEGHIEGIATSTLPDSIENVEETLCNQALICPETGWRFNVAKAELAFYKQNNIPLPRIHFDLRVKNRLALMTPLTGVGYTCTFCHNDIFAYYPQEWGYQKVACVDCYQREIS